MPQHIMYARDLGESRSNKPENIIRIRSMELFRQRYCLYSPIKNKMSHDFENAHPLISKYEYSNYTCKPLCPFNNFFLFLLILLKKSR